MRRRYLPLLVLAFAATAEGAAIEREAPPTYGYAIGDVLRHRLWITPKAGERLDQGALPRPGPLNRWLELRRVDLHPEAGGRLRLDLEYQAFYAPLAVKSLAIPGFTLRFAGSSGESKAEVPAWPFTMAPLHGLAVLEAGGLAPMQPDAGPEAPDAGGPLRRFLVFATAGGLALLYLARLRGLLDFGRRGRHFREACRTLRGLRGAGDDPAALRTGFTAVHRAFDRSLGEPLFAEGLPRFFRDHAGYAGLKPEIEGFFRASYGLFFGDTERVSDFGVARLESLCRACLRAERSRR